MGKRKTKVEAAPAVEADSNVVTLAQVADGYLGWMRGAGKTPSTVASYGQDLEIAKAVLGADAQAESVSASQVAAFDEDTRVVTLKSGKPKAEPTIKKTRRVLRLAYGWALGEGLISVSPYNAPGSPQDRGEPKEAPEAKPKRRRAARAQAGPLAKAPVEAPAAEAPTEPADDTVEVVQANEPLDRPGKPKPARRRVSRKALDAERAAADAAAEAAVDQEG